ncbi:hypothetical protein HG534_09910 [Moraxella osloensis]|nr:hypothetical protein [Moraxella osloensis]MBW4016609.1 hypothetical protein [Moraxella osloensis]
MVTDLILDDFLQRINDTPTSPIELKVTQSSLQDTTDWQMHFNRMSACEMYNEYKFVINQLMFADIDDVKRFALFEEVNKAVSVLLGKLRVNYQTQPGILDEEKQQGLDTVLSVLYLGIMFYHVIWQRAAARPEVAEKKGIISLFRRKPQSLTPTQVIQRCLYSIMVLLRQSLFEKYIGYRKDTQVIWQYLNACYRFAVTNDWQSITLPVKLHSANEYSKQGAPLSIEAIYFHCLMVAVTNPYACRRADIVAIQKVSTQLIKELIISKDLVEKPYLYIDLEGKQPPQLLAVDDTFNPFAATSNCLFVMFSRLFKRLHQTITQGQISTDTEIKNSARQAKLILNNLQDGLKPAAEYYHSHSKCEVVLSFNNIHYMLANKTSLGNLIQSNELPERLKPKAQNTEYLKKYTVVELNKENPQSMCLSHVFSYHNQLVDPYPSSSRGDSYHPLRQLQVNCLIALRKVNGAKTWQLGYIKDNRQGFIDTPNGQPTNKTYLEIEAQVRVHCQNAIPCGVRFQNAGSRQPHFVAAFIIPTAPNNTNSQPRLLMARFGYQVADKLVIRIDNKEINVRLTELLNMTDDIEEYAFVRIQF